MPDRTGKIPDTGGRSCGAGIIADFGGAHRTKDTLSALGEPGSLQGRRPFSKSPFRGSFRVEGMGLDRERASKPRRGPE